MQRIIRRFITFTPLVALLVVGGVAPAQAQRLRGGFGMRVAPRWGLNLGVGPFYDPFWGSYYPYGFIPYAVDHPTAAVRVDASPNQAEVFIDGYLAGTAGTVGVTPGGHTIALYLPGFRTVTEDIYVQPGETMKLKERMDRLAPGETSTPPTAPDRSARPDAPPDARPDQG